MAAIKLLDVHQIAELLNISKRTAEYWQASGRIPGFVRVYGNRRWRSDVLAKWIKNGCPEVCRSVQTESQVMTGSSESGESST